MSLSAYILLGEIKMGIYPFINRQSPAGKEQGFTLIEILAMLIFITIIDVAIVSRRAGSSSDLIAAAEVLKALSVCPVPGDEFGSEVGNRFVKFIAGLFFAKPGQGYI